MEWRAPVPVVYWRRAGRCGAGQIPHLHATFGLGWNFHSRRDHAGAEAYRPEERDRTQAAINFFQFVTLALTSFSSACWSPPRLDSAESARLAPTAIHCRGVVGGRAAPHASGHAGLRPLLAAPFDGKARKHHRWPRVSLRAGPCQPIVGRHIQTGGSTIWIAGYDLGGRRYARWRRGPSAGRHIMAGGGCHGRWRRFQPAALVKPLLAPHRESVAGEQWLTRWLGNWQRFDQAGLG